MITSDNLETCTFVPLSRIVDDATTEFQLNDFELGDMIGELAPWSWGDTNRVMVGNGEFVECLHDALFELVCVVRNERMSDVEAYCDSLRAFLATQVAYVDIVN